MKILLSGGRGFLGNALASHWKGNHELKVLSGRKEFESYLTNVTEQFDLVVHAGFSVDFSQNPESYEANLRSARLLIEKLNAGLSSKLIFLSAAGVLGVSREPVARSEEQIGTTAPGFEAYRESAYIQSKIDCEKLFHSWPGITTTLYLTTVFGKGMPAETRAAFQGKIVPPGGTSYLGLMDFLRAMDLVAADLRQGSFIVNGGNASYWDMCRSTGNHWRILLPSFSMRLLRIAKPFLLRRFLSFSVLESSFGFKYYSSKRFEREYGWKPRETYSNLLRD